MRFFQDASRCSPEASWARTKVLTEAWRPASGKLLKDILAAFNELAQAKVCARTFNDMLEQERARRAKRKKTARWTFRLGALLLLLMGMVTCTGKSKPLYRIAS